jgi:hypothetical protein
MSQQLRTSIEEHKQLLAQLMRKRIISMLPKNNAKIFGGYVRSDLNLKKDYIDGVEEKKRRYHRYDQDIDILFTHTCYDGKTYSACDCDGGDCINRNIREFGDRLDRRFKIESCDGKYGPDVVVDVTSWNVTYKDFLAGYEVSVKVDCVRDGEKKAIMDFECNGFMLDPHVGGLRFYQHRCVRDTYDQMRIIQDTNNMVTNLYIPYEHELENEHAFHTHMIYVLSTRMQKIKQSGFTVRGYSEFVEEKGVVIWIEGKLEFVGWDLVYIFKDGNALRFEKKCTDKETAATAYHHKVLSRVVLPDLANIICDYL